MEIRLDERLVSVKSGSSDQFKRQLQFILDQLISSSGEQESDDDDDDEEEENFEEAALNLDESGENESLSEYVNGEGVPVGEALLCAMYLIRDTDSARIENDLDEAKAGPPKPQGFEPRSFDDDDVIRRAVTPHSFQH